jgi:hypothetical protein
MIVRLEIVTVVVGNAGSAIAVEGVGGAVFDDPVSGSPPLA